jgi:hypothetical protein
VLAAPLPTFLVKVGVPAYVHVRWNLAHVTDDVRDYKNQRGLISLDDLWGKLLLTDYFKQIFLKNIGFLWKSLIQSENIVAYLFWEFKGWLHIVIVGSDSLWEFPLFQLLEFSFPFLLLAHLHILIFSCGCCSLTIIELISFLTILSIISTISLVF